MKLVYCINYTNLYIIVFSDAKRYLYATNTNISPGCILIYGDKMQKEIRITSWENTGTTTISIKTGLGIYRNKDLSIVLLRVHE